MSAAAGTAFGDYVASALHALAQSTSSTSTTAPPAECTVDADCDDANACTVNRCSAGVCATSYVPAGTACPADAFSCTADVCDGQGACAHQPSNAACDDGNECTVDECSATAGCRHSFAAAGSSCSSDGIGCTRDECNGQGACTHAPQDAACDNGVFCDGKETCSATSGCLAGTAPTCNDQDPCTADSCSATRNTCVHTYVLSEQCRCNTNGVCEASEDCDSCPQDCVSSPGGSARCGNFICEMADGEDCLSCPIDCYSKLDKGNSRNFFCCGTTPGLPYAIGCSDARCAGSCTEEPVSHGPYCCGQGGCQAGETTLNCPLDCPSGCTPTEMVETACSDGKDSDCDGKIDCADPDCASAAGCSTCAGPGGKCAASADCCGNAVCIPPTKGRWGTCAAAGAQPEQSGADPIDAAASHSASSTATVAAVVATLATITLVAVVVVARRRHRQAVEPVAPVEPEAVQPESVVTHNPLYIDDGDDDDDNIYDQEEEEEEEEE